MSRGQLTAVIAALALGAVAPRLAAQDTSAAGGAPPDTSGYSGGGGVDTSARPGPVDSTAGGAGADTIGAPGRVGQDSSGALGAGDTSGMSRLVPDSTNGGVSTGTRDGASPSDSASVAEPTKEAGERSTSSP